MAANEHLNPEQFKSYPYKVLRQTSTGYEEVTREAQGPLFHGGRANVGPGAMLTTGRKTNPWGDDGGKSTHVYFTSALDTAASYANELGKRGHVYEVEPTGDFKPDHHDTDFKTPHPLRVVRKVPREDWS